MVTTITLNRNLNFYGLLQEFVGSGTTLSIADATFASVIETGSPPNNAFGMNGTNFTSPNAAARIATSGSLYFGGDASQRISITGFSLTLDAVHLAIANGPTAFVNLLGSINLIGTTGDDVFYFGSGSDTASGDSGHDTFFGGAGVDTLSGDGGNDFIDGGAGADAMSGGSGFDTLSYLTATGAVGINIVDPAQNTGVAVGDTFFSFEAYYLGNLANAADSFFGSLRDEYVYGFAGQDTIRGNGGSDFIDGGAGGDYIDGGDGFDYVSWNTSLGVLVNLLNPSANTGDAKGDTVVNAEAFYMSEFNDVFVGQNGSNIVFGQGGSDSLFGGNASNDWLFGGDGNDFLSGGVLNDLLSGGAGADTYAFVNYATNGLDQVLDFVAGVDRLQLSGSGFGLGAGATFTAGSNFIASAAPAAVIAGGTFLYNTSNGFLYYDIDGTGGQAAIALAQFAGAPIIHASDFFVI